MPAPPSTGPEPAPRISTGSVEKQSLSEPNPSPGISTGSVERVTVIGLGNIGGGVARNLVRAGLRVTGVDLDPLKVAGLVEEGGHAGADLLRAVADADVVFTSLPGPQHVEAVADEILPAMRPPTIWVDLSTNDLETFRRIQRRHAQSGVGMVDAPVSGGPEGAEAGTLSIFVGGSAEIVRLIEPLLEIIGDKIDHLGSNGAGIVAKIAQVTLCYTQTVTLIEALLLGVKGGIEPAKMLDLIQHSAGSSYCADVYGPEIVAGTYDASFPISHAAKDLRLAMELAQSVGAELPYTAHVADLYRRTEERYGPSAAHLLAAQMIEHQNDLVLHEHESARPRVDEPGRT